MESSIQIEERAAEWLAKRDGGDWSAAEEATFQAWLDESTLHVVAFVRLEAVWKQAKRLKALSAGVAPGEVPSPDRWPLASSKARAAPPVRRMKPLHALVASLLIAVAGSIAWYVWPHGPAYRTPVGGLASVPMSDGSRVTLNTDSKVFIAVSEAERRVELERGEAFFEVAKDPHRPFVVSAGNKRVIAVGTAFSVRRDGSDVRVAVSEGQVRIEDAEQSDRTGSETEKILTLSAGRIARATDGGVLVQEATIPQIESYLGWRTGYLIFRDMTLAEAVAEFNRYNTSQILIADPEVAAIRISGKFRATQFDAFVRLLEDGFPVRAQMGDGRIVLSDSRKVAETAAAAQ